MPSMIVPMCSVLSAAHDRYLAEIDAKLASGAWSCCPDCGEVWDITPAEMAARPGAACATCLRRGFPYRDPDPTPLPVSEPAGAEPDTGAEMAYRYADLDDAYDARLRRGARGGRSRTSNKRGVHGGPRASCARRSTRRHRQR